MRKGVLAAGAACFLLLGCTTDRQTEPARTATEEILISTAADRAAAAMQPHLPPGDKVFVDAQYFDGLDSKYAIAAIRGSLAKQGVHLVADRKDAQTVVEIRNGAQSIDQHAFLVGIPTFKVPIPLAGDFTFPELALYKKAREIGVAKYALVAYDAKSGAYRSDAGPDFATAHQHQFALLFFFHWEDDDMKPSQDQEFDDGDAKK